MNYDLCIEKFSAPFCPDAEFIELCPHFLRSPESELILNVSRLSAVERVLLYSLVYGDY